MSKTALLFAGQGAQVVGMGKDLVGKFASAAQWFERANTALGYDLASICFNGPEPDLTRTENAQPGIFLVSWAAFELLKAAIGLLQLFERNAALIGNHLDARQRNAAVAIVGAEDLREFGDRLNVVVFRD